MKIWQLQKAKAQLSDVVRQAEFEPQCISLRGEEKVMVINAREFQRLSNPKQNLASFLRSSPLFGLDIEFERDKSHDREVDL